MPDRPAPRVWLPALPAEQVLAPRVWGRWVWVERPLEQPAAMAPVDRRAALRSARPARPAARFALARSAFRWFPLLARREKQLRLEWRKQAFQKLPAGKP